MNPCQVIDPCARNADCRVHDTLPLRTMSCLCQPGFTGNGEERCDLITEPVEAVGCRSDDECLDSEACNNGDCSNPCYSNNPCSSSAICTPKRHRATCNCPPGFEGDPYQRCVPSKTIFKLICFNRSFILEFPLSVYLMGKSSNTFDFAKTQLLIIPFSTS